MDEGYETPSADSENFSQLDYQPSFKSIRRGRLERLLIASLLLASGAVFAVTVVPSLLSGDLSASILVGGLVILASVLATIAILSRLKLSERLASITTGMLTLEFPIRLAKGGRTRQIRLSDISDVTPTVSMDGENGVRILLADGSSFFLDQDVFRNRGHDIMGKLSANFGHDYTEELKSLLLEGKRVGFRVIRPVRLDGDQLVLKKKVYRYDGKATKRIPLGDIAGTEEVSTYYSGPAVLVVLTDGTRFLLPRTGVEGLGLDQNPRWLEVSNR